MSRAITTDATPCTRRTVRVVARRPGRAPRGASGVARSDTSSVGARTARLVLSLPLQDADIRAWGEGRDDLTKMRAREMERVGPRIFEGACTVDKVGRAGTTKRVNPGG